MRLRRACIAAAFALTLSQVSACAESGPAAVAKPRMQSPGTASSLLGGEKSSDVAPRVLRVCADPNNLPFSNRREEGFENAIAAVLAGELSAELEYAWYPQRRGFIRNTLKARLCDVILGVPAKLEMVDTTEAFYRSSYVFVTRAGGPVLRSLDDDRLRRLKIGVHVIGDDYANSPPVHALSRRGIVDNVVGYRLLGDYSEENPPARLVEAAASGAVDVAIIWGPFGGYFAEKQRPPLEVRPVHQTEGEAQFLPMAYDIALGVRRGEHGLKAELDEALEARRADIRKILEEYRVPHSEES